MMTRDAVERRLLALGIGITVALHTPAHRELDRLRAKADQVQETVAAALPRLGPYALHGLDRPVAGLARHLRAHVWLMREPDVLGDLEDSHPRNRLLALPVVVELGDLRVALGRDDLVATHAHRER